MIFEALYESSRRGELLLIDGGFCHWHLRKDGQLTIREIIATKKGAGSKMLEILKQNKDALCIVAKCPNTLLANGWYRRKGFHIDHIEVPDSGKKLIVWKLDLERNIE